MTSIVLKGGRVIDATGERHAWVRVESLRDRAGEAPSFEAQAGPRNTVFLATRGIARLTLLLSDDLADLSRPVTVVLNGRQAFRALALRQPGVELALDQLELEGAHEEHAETEDHVHHRDDVDRHRVLVGILRTSQGRRSWSSRRRRRGRRRFRGGSRADHGPASGRTAPTAIL